MSSNTEQQDWTLGVDRDADAIREAIPRGDVQTVIENGGTFHELSAAMDVRDLLAAPPWQIGKRSLSNEELYRLTPEQIGAYIDLRNAAREHEDVPEGANGWTTLPFLALADEPVIPPDVAGLFYLGQRHILSGEADLGKTWIALWACVQEILAGHPAVWVNTDEAPPAELFERLILLGLTREQIESSFLYLQPDVHSDHESIAALVDEAVGRGARLVVVDSFNSAMMVEGLDPLGTTDVETFWRRLATPLCRAGIAFVAIDHLPKSSDNHGRYSYGSERKLSGASVHIGVRGKGFSRDEGGGKVRLHTLKDRTGYHTRPYIGDFTLTVVAGIATGEIIAVSEDEAAGRLTGYMERVSRTLESHAGAALTTAQIVEAVGGNRQHVLTALRDLHEGGFVTRTTEGRGYVYAVTRPYSEDG
jgi:hypothetical protein